LPEFTDTTKTRAGYT